MLCKPLHSKKTVNIAIKLFLSREVPPENIQCFWKTLKIVSSNHLKCILYVLDEKVLYFVCKGLLFIEKYLHGFQVIVVVLGPVSYLKR